MARTSALIEPGRLRLYSGLVLFLFTLTHLMNHALGLVSLEAMELGRVVFLAVWRSPLEWILFGAFLVHPVLGLRKVWQRRTLRISAGDWLQIASGLIIPYYLTIHVLGTGVLHYVQGLDDSYAYLLNLLWPGGIQRQTELLLVVWVHGCIGVHHWLKLERWYGQAKPIFLTLAVLLPTLAFFGMLEGAREVAARAQADPAWIAGLRQVQNWGGNAERAWIYRLEDHLLLAFYGLIAIAALYRLGRRIVIARTGSVEIEFPNHRIVRVPKGSTVLEAARSARLPHASVCGGRGRCSTCRVRVSRGLERLSGPSGSEARVLARIQAQPDVRLACQIRPTHTLQVTPLVAVDRAADEVRRPMDPGQGTERELVVMFADLRGFTRISEQHLPYDVVFLLNRWFALSGQVVERMGGRVDKFIGDGVMALFGLDDGPEAGARAALNAAKAISVGLERISAEMRGELKEPLRLGVGLHAGNVILGELGWGQTIGLTVIGDVVNVASRLETACKEFGAEAVISADVFRLAGIEPPFEPTLFEVRGRQRSLQVVAVPRLAELDRKLAVS
ncbi:MAG TPA: adenylate/guanylate cyclase domain-containing protein [Geminicoccus sp.]|jgi:adenylate cyclase|uniref:adenylate/guanylate cyclase domain-containing protein n=1 Tax=Geminicoccus sp. TaxID=2024832 RepID=UPI002E380DD5|nr:adenylate/guanylate cyclase domain-containing protein [Geminicoccus sp.]HEX2529737.1 adenylate/guanylate cyclase domain-containing protein [Geminicoccus sp.]